MNKIHDISWERLDLNLLRLFVAIWQQRSLAQVSQSMHLSPSAISHALRRLRLALGDELFVRDGRALRPTARARTLAPLVQTHLDALQEALAGVQMFDPLHSERHFKLGMRESLEPLILPELLAVLRSSGPGLGLTSTRLDRASLSRALLEGELDLGLDIAQPVQAGIEQAPIVREPLCVVMRSGHPLMSELSVASYLAAEHIVVSGRSQGPAVEDLALQRQQAGVRRIALRCQSYQAANQIVAQTELLLTMPLRLAQRLGEPLGNQRRMLPLPAPALELQLFWCEHPRADPAIEWLRRQILDADRAR